MSCKWIQKCNCNDVNRKNYAYQCNFGKNVHKGKYGCRCKYRCIQCSVIVPVHEVTKCTCKFKCSCECRCECTCTTCNGGCMFAYHLYYNDNYNYCKVTFLRCFLPRRNVFQPSAKPGWSNFCCLKLSRQKTTNSVGERDDNVGNCWGWGWGWGWGWWWWWWWWWWGWGWGWGWGWWWWWWWWWGGGGRGGGGGGGGGGGECCERRCWGWWCWGWRGAGWWCWGW